MKTKIDSTNAHEYECHHFIAGASMLELPPGNWPRTIETTLGNGQPFVRYSLDEAGAKYTQLLGCIHLSVLNT